MRHLLDNEHGLATTVDVWPGAVEELAEDGVQWLTSAWKAITITCVPSSPSPSSRYGSGRSAQAGARGDAKRGRGTHGVLALEGRNKPAEDALHALLGRVALRDGRKRVRVLAPVCRELGERHGREDDWGAKVAAQTRGAETRDMGPTIG